jgi:hypothetical protein
MFIFGDAKCLTAIRDVSPCTSAGHDQVSSFPPVAQLSKSQFADGAFGTRRKHDLPPSLPPTRAEEEEEIY